MSTKLHLFSSVLLAIVLLSVSIDALRNAVRGKKCAPQQVVNKLTVYEDGAIEAECGALPCGTTGICSEDLSSCKAASEVFSGMKWARNGQSLLLRCCALQASNKVYIGTDLVTLGSYYTGGAVPEKDMMGANGVEYDFVANARTEQGGVRVWVYRIVCPAQGGAEPQRQPQRQPRKQQQQQPQAQNQNKDGGEEEQPKFAEAQDAQVESQVQQQIPVALAAVPPPVAATEEQEEQPVRNPLQYRPRRNQQQSQTLSADPVNRVL